MRNSIEKLQLSESMMKEIVQYYLDEKLLKHKEFTVDSVKTSNPDLGFTVVMTRPVAEGNT